MFSFKKIVIEKRWKISEFSGGKFGWFSNKNHGSTIFVSGLMSLPLCIFLFFDIKHTYLLYIFLYLVPCYYRNQLSISTVSRTKYKLNILSKYPDEQYLHRNLQCLPKRFVSGIHSERELWETIRDFCLHLLKKIPIDVLTNWQTPPPAPHAGTGCRLFCRERINQIKTHRTKRIDTILFVK